jgi:hypothetical protein
MLNIILYWCKHTIMHNLSGCHASDHHLTTKFAFSTALYSITAMEASFIVKANMGWFPSMQPEIRPAIYFAGNIRHSRTVARQKISHH